MSVLNDGISAWSNEWFLAISYPFLLLPEVDQLLLTLVVLLAFLQEAIFDLVSKRTVGCSRPSPSLHALAVLPSKELILPVARLIIRTELLTFIFMYLAKLRLNFDPLFVELQSFLSLSK